MIMAIDFKNVGYKQYGTRKIDNTEQSKIPIGIKTPLEFGANGEGFYAMNFSVGAQIKDNFRNLLQTNHGERVGRYLYGANLQQLVLEFTNKENFEGEAAERINTAAALWMPFLQLGSFESQPILEDNQFIGKIGITITYSVPEAQIFDERIQTILYVS
jgi:phage baseplate assembly protein W